jgi:uncharacterized lipoprotein YmbA
MTSSLKSSPLVSSTAALFALALSLTVLLAGCGSSPHTSHYLLTAKEAPVPSGESPSLGIGPIAIPQYLARNNLVYNQRGNQLQVSGQERWAESLDDGIQRVLAINLAGLLNTQDVRYFPWHPKRAPQYGIKINLLTLDANDQQAILTAEWLVYRAADAEPVKRRISRLQHPMPAGELNPAEVAPAYSALLYQLSEIIAEAITAAETADAET